LCLKGLTTTSGLPRGPVGRAKHIVRQGAAGEAREGVLEQRSAPGPGQHFRSTVELLQDGDRGHHEWAAAKLTVWFTPAAEAWNLTTLRPPDRLNLLYDEARSTVALATDPVLRRR
jgi:hypothetical protein